MKPRARILAVVLLVAIQSHASSASQRWCGDSTYPACPQQSMGWTLFVDANLGTPDFWWTDSVTVREIYRCEHGIQFLFVTQQKGQRCHTALVFPKPSRRMLAERLDLAPGSERLAAEYAHYAARYDALTKALEDMSGGMMVDGVRASFREWVVGDTPVIVPKERLALRWRGGELLLRGYLDVYFAPST